MSYTVAVAGASGYAGGELLRLLAMHPDFEVRTLTGFQNAGQALADVHPHLRSFGDRILAETDSATLADHDIVFLALPHGKSGRLST
ncbi:MAG: N-acetyl-gamma-glutamyl-phosphate reductase, partial [Microbacteriaceae bacterium]